MNRIPVAECLFKNYLTEPLKDYFILETNSHSLENRTIVLMEGSFFCKRRLSSTENPALQTSLIQ